MTATRRVYVAPMQASALQDAFDFLGGADVIRPGARVVLKPNLTWREPLPGVTTTPTFIRAVVELLRDWTDDIAVVESDGGYHSFKAEEAFASHGLYDLRDRFGVKVVNLSTVAPATRAVDIAGRPVAVELPRLLLEDTDLFVTLPVPKVHVMTGVSLGFKNQWGCQPGTMRLRNHPQFDRKVLAINRLLRPQFALYDGTYFLDRTGPMIGEPVAMNLLVAADDVGAGDRACCEIMGVDVSTISHLRLAQREGMMPRSLAEIATNRPLASLATRRFELRRTLINHIALLAFRSGPLTRLFYDSAAADPIHRVLYAIRRNRVVGRLLYGPTGPPAAEGRRS